MTFQRNVIAITSSMVVGTCFRGILPVQIDGTSNNRFYEGFNAFWYEMCGFRRSRNLRKVKVL